MDILLVTSSFNDEIHGSDDKKKTGCGISLIKPENISKYRLGGIMTDLKEITCDKCKERLAKKIIRSDKKEMAKILKEERARAKKGIEDEGIVPLGNTTAKITKTPEQKRQEEEERAAAERREAEAKRAAEEAARKAEEEARLAAEEAARKAAEEEAALAAKKKIPGTGIAMDDSLAQFAINVPKEEEPEPEPVQDDFLAQFAIQKPADEEIMEEPETPLVQDDFLAQFAIPTPQPEYLPADDEEKGIGELSAAYDNDDSVINVSENELKAVHKEEFPQPEEEPEVSLEGNSDWDYVANQIFGFDGVDIPEPEPQPAEMEELPLPSQLAAGQISENRTADHKPEVPALEDIVPPTLDDITPPVLDDIVPPVLEDLAAPAAEKPSVPALDEISVPEVPALDDISAFSNDVPQVSSYDEPDAVTDDFADFEIPEVPVLNSISAVPETVVEETIEDEIEETVEESPDEFIEEAADETVEEIIEETAEETVDEIIEETADETVEEIIEETAEESADEFIEEAADETVEEIIEEAVEESADEFIEETAVETVAEQIPEAPAAPAPVQTVPPVQPVPVQMVPPMQAVPPVQTASPVQAVPPVQMAPPVQTVPPVQPQIINVPQLAGYDAAGQPIYTYMQMQMTGYDQNGQPIYIPIGGQQPPIPPQPAAVKPRPMMGMSNTIGGQMGANIQKPFVKLDAPTQTPAYIKAKLGNQGADGQYVQPSANISKIAVNPHTKETSKAFVNAISNSKDYANKNLIETQGLHANTPVLSSIEDVLSQMGDNSLKNKKEKTQAEVNLGSEYKGSVSRTAAPAHPAAAKRPENDIRNMSKSELKEKKKQDKYAAKFKKDLAKRGF